jgi:hypothetical protein
MEDMDCTGVGFQSMSVGRRRNAPVAAEQIAPDTVSSYGVEDMSGE